MVSGDMSSKALDHGIPQLAASESEVKKIFEAQKKASTSHDLHLADSRNLAFLEDESIHLALTSPPYWTLKRYNEHEGQLGHVQDYEEFLIELGKVWSEVYRVLVPGGRLVCVVGDVCVSRRAFGRHVVFPLHADICVICRKIGFDNLNPIIWHKISNAQFEANQGSKFLGKPYEPNAIIKNDMEYILMQRKPGGYRKPTPEQREHSRIAKDKFNKWFRQIWKLGGASTRKHPAPFPLKLAMRLVQMFSFWHDTVLDPFSGTGTTLAAAMKTERNSVGIELSPKYAQMAAKSLQQERVRLFDVRQMGFFRSVEEGARMTLVEDPGTFHTSNG